jgi:hypothetical protein
MVVEFDGDGRMNESGPSREETVVLASTSLNSSSVLDISMAEGDDDDRSGGVVGDAQSHNSPGDVEIISEDLVEKVSPAAATGQGLSQSQRAEEGAAAGQAKLTLEEIKSLLPTVQDQMEFLITQAEEEFENELSRIEEEAKSITSTIQSYRQKAVANVESQRSAFRQSVQLGMSEFKAAKDKATENILCLELIQGKFATAFRQIGMIP